MMEYVCPKCGSSKIIPLYAKSQIWKCPCCGYSGRPQIINSSMKEFWKYYKQIENSKSNV